MTGWEGGKDRGLVSCNASTQHHVMYVQGVACAGVHSPSRTQGTAHTSIGGEQGSSGSVVIETWSHTMPTHGAIYTSIIIVLYHHDNY